MITIFNFLTHPESDRGADEVNTPGAPLPVHPRFLLSRAIRVVEIHPKPVGPRRFDRELASVIGV